MRMEQNITFQKDPLANPEFVNTQHYKTVGDLKVVDGEKVDIVLGEKQGHGHDHGGE